MEVTDVSAEGRELLETFEVIGRARRELGPRACERYVVSFTRGVSDLEVVFLARAAALAPGEVRPGLLLEQLEDLDRAGVIARDVLADETLRRELGHGERGRAGDLELEVMVGYSDSGKQVGYVASSVALREAQLALAEVAEEAGVTLTVFHGRGGALGRGGGPESEAIRAQPAVAVRGRLRVTEQGETVTARYAHPEIAERDLEQTFAAVLAATFEHYAPRGIEELRDGPLLHLAAVASHEAYLELTADEDRLARYTVAATPVEDVAHLPLGSHPASRKGGMTLESLRAIPWVFSWTQSRHGIPGWFGAGTAIDVLARELGAGGVRELCGRSRFFRALVRNCDLSLVRSDIDVAREYARLAEPDAAKVFSLIEVEHARTVAALREVLGITTPLATRPYLVASVRRRNPALNVLSHIQIEALRRRRSGAPIPIASAASCSRRSEASRPACRPRAEPHRLPRPSDRELRRTAPPSSIGQWLRSPGMLTVIDVPSPTSDGRLEPALIEQRLLELAHTTDAQLTAPALAYYAGCSIEAAAAVLDDLVARDRVEMDVTDDGAIVYQLRGRQQLAAPTRPLRPEVLAPVGSAWRRTHLPSPAGAAVLTALIPGAGHLYAGRAVAAVLWFFAVSLGYTLLVPGLVLHLFSMASAAASAAATQLAAAPPPRLLASGR